MSSYSYSGVLTVVWEHMVLKPRIGMFIDASYCNSVVQALFYTKPFREAVINYPRSNVSPPPPPKVEADSKPSAETTSITPVSDQTSVTSATALTPNPVTVTAPVSLGAAKPVARAKSTTGFGFSRAKLNRANSADQAEQTTQASPVRAAGSINGTHSSVFGSSNGTALTSAPPNPYAPSPYSLNGALASTSVIAQNALKDPNAPPPLPSLPVNYSRHEEYGMKESLFTCLKDLFERIVGESGKSGVIAPTKLVEVLKRENGPSSLVCG
jgi:ubiquitin carboxyl-terminal hydrolase 9/13